ncbi:MAG: hotdog fold thioesterase [Gammaproteobacteria bacterium]
MAIWIEPIDLTIIRERSRNTMVEYLDIQFIEIGDDFLTATMPVDHRTRQPLGYLNGGASCALAESVGSTAANFCIKQAERFCVGLDINANHLRPATQGLVTAIARPVHLGQRTQVWNIDIFDDNNKQICISRLTMAVVERGSKTS